MNIVTRTVEFCPNFVVVKVLRAVTVEPLTEVKVTVVPLLLVMVVCPIVAVVVTTFCP